MRHDLDSLKKEKGDVSKAIAAKKKADKKDPCEEETNRSKEISQAILVKEKEVVEAEEKINSLMNKIGNIV